jgi:hypothetical protein
MEKHSMVRTVYLYLFALVGLALLITGTVKFLDMGLKTFIFKGADEPERISQNYYYGYTPALEKIISPEDVKNVEDLTDEEKQSLKEFIEGYQIWKEKSEKIDHLSSRRQQEASINLSMILVGLPLYLYHWGTIRREIKNRS